MENIMKKGKYYDRSSCRLILIPLLAFSQATLASEPAVNTINLNDFKFTLPALAVIVVALLAHVIIPIITHSIKRKKSINTYFAFIKTSVNSSKKLFGSECDVKFTEKLLNTTAKESDWLNILKTGGVGVPEIFHVIHNGFEKYKKVAKEDNENNRYIPYVSYAGMPVAELSHDHPIWSLSSSDTEVLAEYLLSQAQVESSIARLYSDEFLKMAYSENPKRQLQWFKSGHSMAADIAEHYINTIKLEMYIAKR